MALGRLTIHSTNPRYFSDGTGKAVVLVGPHHWFTSQDAQAADPPAAFNFEAWLDLCEANNANCLRGWVWEETKYDENGPFVFITPHPYARTGPGNAADGKPKFDLTIFNQAYFDRVRARAIAANARGIYYPVMLFQGWSVRTNDVGHAQVWANHPFNSANNINSINGDPLASGNGLKVHTLDVAAITVLQEAYVEKMVDTLNDLDNILYEVSNESHTASLTWQQHICAHLKTYQASKPKQHLVGITSPLEGTSLAAMLASNADFISPGQADGYTTTPPAAAGTKIIVADSDHIFGLGGDRVWAWKNFLRGAGSVIMMDAYIHNGFNTPIDATDISFRANMGYIRTFAERMDLKAMTPQNSLATTGYCLAKAQASGEYLVYQPGTGAFDVNLTATPGGIRVEWFNPATGVTTVASDVTGGSTRTFTPPFAGDVVLYLRSSTTPTIYPDTRLSVDFMKNMKDTVTSQLPTTEKTTLAVLAAESYSNYGAFSVPLAPQAAFVAAGSTPSPRTIEAEWLDWCEVLHGEGLGIIFRPAFPGMESDDNVNGLYGFQWKVGANRIPAGTYDSVINQAQYDSWCGIAYLFIKNNPGCFNDLGPNPDVFAFAPERANHHIFNDATSFLPHTSPGIQANYVEFYKQLNMVCQKAFEEIGKPGIIMHDTANNYSEPRSGWMPQAFFTNAQRISVDYYLNYGGSGFSAQAAVDDMLWLYDNRGHHRLCWQEYGPIQTAALPMAQRAADLLAFCDEVYERMVLPGKLEEINFWAWWDGQNTSFLNKTGSGASAVYTLNEMGGVMKQFYKDIYDQLVDSEPEPEPPPPPAPPPSRGRMSARRRKLILASLN